MQISVTHSEIAKNSKLNTPVKPFLRWAGGKQNLVKVISQYLPHFSFNEYYEPFLGAGSLFFYNNFDKATLSDVNSHLINSYVFIKEHTEELNSRLLEHKKLASSSYYYKQRELFNYQRFDFTVEQAARFIFLIHTSFNGIFRVNKNGEYNVPFGKDKPSIPNLEHLLIIKEKLSSCNLFNCMYEDIFSKVGKGDLVYLDPPYPALSETSFFQHYTIDKFTNSRQEELAFEAQKLSNKGVYVLISNAETDLIKALYKDWNICQVSTVRYINCKSSRKVVNELIIKNY